MLSIALAEEFNRNDRNKIVNRGKQEEPKHDHDLAK